MDNNVILIQGDQALLIDAANDADRILSEISDRDAPDVVTIMTTHGRPLASLEPSGDSDGSGGRLPRRRGPTGQNTQKIVVCPWSRITTSAMSQRSANISASATKKS